MALARGLALVLSVALIAVCRGIARRLVQLPTVQFSHPERTRSPAHGEVSDSHGGAFGVVEPFVATRRLDQTGERLFVNYGDNGCSALHEPVTVLRIP
jgi:hypothetical protein